MRGNKGILGLAVVAALAIGITTMAAGASASGGNAVAAKKKKKKCKKGFVKKKVKAKKGKKKFKCVKKNEGTANTSLVRATLTWAPTNDDPSADDADLDLFVFDASGNRAGNGADAIPLSTLSPDVTGKSGTETFTDLAFNQKRPLSFGVCYTVGGSVHTQFTITYVTADGVSHTDTQRPGSSFHYDYSGGPSIPSGYCPN